VTYSRYAPYEQHAAGSAAPQADSKPQHVVTFSPRNAALIIAAAHPTPLSTNSAPVGQLTIHAPHSIQASARTICTRRISRAPGANTLWGQTALHIPQLMQASALNANVLRLLSATNPTGTPAVSLDIIVSLQLVILILLDVV